jgi:chromosome transmission fidelity protein 1
MPPASGSPHPYGFPFEPYDVQKQLMAALTEAIDSRAVGLFESPTGTGKTLSLICATMSWLEAHQLDPAAYERPSDLQSDAHANDDPDWVTAHATDAAVSKLRSVQELRRRAFSKRLTAAQSIHSPGVGTTGRKIQRIAGVGKSRASRTDGDDESRFLLQDGEDNDPVLDCSDEEFSDLDGDGFEYRHRADAGADMDIDPDVAPRLRIVFATRTHTQLAQFIEEMRKTRYGARALSLSASSATVNGMASSDGNLPLSVVTFGSRKVMCVNNSVRDLPTSMAVADRCRELIKAPGPGSSFHKRGRNGGGSRGCPHKNEMAERTLRDASIVHMHDVEELSAAGLRIGGCPYFSARASLSSGAIDVVGVPYTAILHQATRESLGLTIDDRTVVVFDEAHNIVSTVSDIHASVVTKFALEASRSALAVYRSRYVNRLAPQSLFFIDQIMAVIDGLLGIMPSDSKASNRVSKAKVVSPSSLVFDAKIDHLNIFALSSFIRDSRLCQKLLGFVDAGHVACASAARDSPSLDSTQQSLRSKNGAPETSATTADEEDRRRRAKHGIAAFESFLHSLNAATENSRIAIFPPAHKSGGAYASVDDARLKYFVLNPGSLFSSAVGKARSILLVGGTLSPRQAMKDALLAHLPLSRPVREFECDHVIPAKNLLAVVAGVGPSGVMLEFTHRTRQSFDAMDDLGRSVTKLASVSSGGFVIFFASYAFMTSVIERWTESGCISEIANVKPLFTESRGFSSAWTDYSAAIGQNGRRGAVLTAVMGGRLSEGINFSDDLGRVVMVVGMPFANANDVETAEVLRSLGSMRKRGEYLENACLTVVNQAVGRAIRHSADFATIVLCDRRFSRPETLAKLPRFVRQSMALDSTRTNAFSSVQSSIASFFNGHS